MSTVRKIIPLTKIEDLIFINMHFEFWILEWKNSVKIILIVKRNWNVFIEYLNNICLYWLNLAI